MNKLYLLIAILFLSLNPSFVSANEPKSSFKFSGYYKNLFTTSKTTSTKEDFFADIERLRLEVEKQFSDFLSAKIAYDNEIILNDFSNTSDFELIRQNNQKNLAFLDGDNVISDRKHVYWKHSLYRAYLKYFSHSFQAVLGKQAIDWSRMRFYHPFDLFNTISPLDLEKDEKIGADAINLEFYPDSISLINLIYVPYKNTEKTSFGLRLSRKIQDYDLFLIAASNKKDKVAGFGFDGYLFKAGLRSELTYTKKDNKKNFLRGAIGLDHNFTSKIYTIAEYFYNGGAEKDPEQFLNSYEFSRRALSMKKHILGAGIEYELSGITKIANYLFYDFAGRSFFINPEIKSNIRANLDLSIGAQLFTGSDTSEFGLYHRLFYFQLKKYF